MILVITLDSLLNLLNALKIPVADSHDHDDLHEIPRVKGNAQMKLFRVKVAEIVFILFLVQNREYVAKDVASTD